MQYHWADVSEAWGRAGVLRLLELAEECLQDGGVVVVHCVAGRHRTGAFCTLLAVTPEMRKE